MQTEPSRPDPTPRSGHDSGYGSAASRTLAVTLRSASLVPCGHASRRLSSGFARRRGRGADQPEVRGRKGWARLARLARQRDSEMGSHIGILHAPAAASPRPGAPRHASVPRHTLFPHIKDKQENVADVDGSAARLKHISKSVSRWRRFRGGDFGSSGARSLRLGK